MIGYRYQIIKLDSIGREVRLAARAKIGELQEYGIALDEERTAWIVYDKLKKKTISRDECFVIWSQARRQN